MFESPTIFWAIWKAVSPFIDPVTRKKVKFVSEKHGPAEMADEIPNEVPIQMKLDFLLSRDSHPPTTLSSAPCYSHHCTLLYPFEQSYIMCISSGSLSSTSAIPFWATIYHVYKLIIAVLNTCTLISQRALEIIMLSTISLGVQILYEGRPQETVLNRNKVMTEVDALFKRHLFLKVLPEVFGGQAPAVPLEEVPVEAWQKSSSAKNSTPTIKPVADRGASTNSVSINAGKYPANGKLFHTRTNWLCISLWTACWPVFGI